MPDGSLLLLGLSGLELTPQEAALFRRLQPAGYVLANRNIVSPAQTRKLTDDLRGFSMDPPIIAIDEEGGSLSRIRQIAPAPPSASALAARKDMRKIAEAATLTGTLLRLLGINMNLAPVLDLDHFPGAVNSMTSRCWGRDPQRVIDHAGQWNRWTCKRGGMTGCAKHFPAGGRAGADAHHGFPSCPATLAELQREDVLPYTALMPELDAVMTGHVWFPNIDPDFPASLSPRIIRRFLRDQLGFDRHLVLTDDLDAEPVANRFTRGEDAGLAIAAGNDLAMIRHRPETAEDAARAIAGLPRSITSEAIERVEKFRHKKLHRPPPWSDAKWAEACAAMAGLAAEFPDDDSSLPASPVSRC